MPWSTKFPDLKNDPTYLDPRVTAAETQLAQSLNQLGGAVTAKPFDKGIVTIVVDDGTSDHYTTVFPQFQARNIPFGMALDIQNDLRATSGKVTLDQLQEMYNTGLVEMIAHSMTHITMDSSVPDERVAWELKESYRLIRRLGFDCKAYVAPSSTFNPTANNLKVLKDTFDVAYTQYQDARTAPASALTFANPVDLYNLCRANVTAGLTLLKSFVDYAAANKVWLTIYAHKVGVGGGYEISPTDLASLLDYTLSKDVYILKPSDVVNMVSTRLVGKQRPERMNRDTMEIQAKGLENQLKNASFAGTNIPTNWSWSNYATGGVTTAIESGSPGNSFKVTTDGTNTGINETLLLTQDIPFNLLNDFIPACLSVYGQLVSGSNANIKVRMVALNSSGSALGYDYSQQYSLGTSPRRFEVPMVFPPDSAIATIRAAIYVYNVNANNAISFKLNRPKVEFGLIASPWTDSKAAASTSTTQQAIGTFSAKPSAPITVPHATWTKVNFDTKDWDVSNWFDTANNRFTPQQAGYYRLSASVNLNPPANGGALYLSIYKNGSEFKRISMIHASTNGSPIEINGSGIVQANGTTDYFEIYVYHNYGSFSGATVSTVQANCMMQGEFIGTT